MTKLSEIKKLIKDAKTNKQRYRDNIQQALVLFVKSYNNELNRNSQPLKELIEVAGVDSRFIRPWLAAAITNLARIEKTKAGGFKMILENKAADFEIDEEAIQRLWYTPAEKADVQAAVGFGDINALIKAFNAFNKKVEESVATLGIQQNTLNALSNLKMQLESYKNN